MIHRLLLFLFSTTKTDILDLDATELSKRLASRELSAVSLMEHTLDRIERLNPHYNAIVGVRDRVELLKEAKRADDTPRKGWLHGIPLAVKDLSNVKGLPTTYGGLLDQPLATTNVALTSDPFVENLLRQGAIIIGKTNAPVAGLGSHTVNPVFGATRNPYNAHKSCGGSSGGAAVAVALRLTCLSDGSDMMGSLRNPAGWNAIYSLRPTTGMFVEPLNFPFPISTLGPMAKSPCDLAQFLECMVGDAATFQAPAEWPDSMNFKILWLGDWAGSLAFEEGILEVCWDALQLTRDKFGIDLVDGSSDSLYPLDKLWTSWTTIRSKVVSFNHKMLRDAKPDLTIDVKPELEWEVQRGETLSSQEQRSARLVAKDFLKTLDELFEEYDAIALPTAQVWPFDIDTTYPMAIGDTVLDTYHRWMEVAVPVSLSGLPCVTIPAGFRNGLPMGLQIAGKRDSDTKLLQFANLYHKATDFGKQRPPV